MEVTINSRKLGTAITFSRPGSHYVYADLNGQPGTLGKQICESGRLLGSTVTYSGDDYDRFKTICRRWLAAYVRKIDA